MMDNENKEKTSLKKSHSVWSNIKLVVLCILVAVSIAILFIGIALLGRPDVWGILMLIIGLLLTAISSYLVLNYKR